MILRLSRRQRWQVNPRQTFSLQRKKLIWTSKENLCLAWCDEHRLMETPCIAVKKSTSMWTFFYNFFFLVFLPHIAIGPLFVSGWMAFQAKILVRNTLLGILVLISNCKLPLYICFEWTCVVITKPQTVCINNELFKINFAEKTFSPN